ncbi:MAG TPA: potassium channel family protein [Pyrinomonadaceae bacterium]
MINQKTLARLGKEWPFKLFAIYVTFIFIFAFLYQTAHRYWPQSFAFHTDIVRTKNLELKNSVQTELDEARKKLELFKMLPELLKNTKDVGNTYDAAMGWYGISFNVDKYEFAFELSPLKEKSGSTDNLLYILIPGKVERWGPTKVSLAREVVRLSKEYPRPYPIEAYQEMASTVISNLEQQVNQKQLYLQSLNGYTPEYWSFLDFLYFSTITQATVGYGDILPNSTLVRVLVILQTLLGLFLAGFAISLASTEIKKAVKGKT